MALTEVEDFSCWICRQGSSSLLEAVEIRRPKGETAGFRILVTQCAEIVIWRTLGMRALLSSRLGDLVRLRPSSSDAGECLDEDKQLLGVYRLREVLVHAGGDADLAVAFHRVRRESDDRHMGAGHAFRFNNELPLLTRHREFNILAAPNS